MNNPVIYALGFFDGVHLGHRALLEQCRALADRYGCKAGAVTFAAHPETLVLGKKTALLNTNADRKTLLNSYGMDTVLQLPFNKALMNTHWSDFLRQLMDSGAAGFVCGEDFRFGAKGNGTAKKLAAFCQSRQLPWAIVPDQMMDGGRISSTRIRQLIGDGQMEQANRLLGHTHILTGTVVEGQQLGRTIGIPTANIPMPEELLVPKFGVYATYVTAEGKTYPAITNIGTRPTVNGKGVTVESYLLDFAGDLYGKEITVSFCGFLRPERKFNSLEELKTRIAADITQARQML